MSEMQVSLSCLPKELRLYIWQLTYLFQPPRLVELRTRSHDGEHGEDTFCPRYSPSLAPTVINICHEARTEAHYQARKAGHIVRLHHDPISVASEQVEYTAEFYFRFETDILYLPLEDRDVKHFDDSPENGLLPHFRRATDCDASLLRKIAITSVIKSGYHDGSISNSLRDFPNISHIYMIVPDDVVESQSQRPLFVRAARRVLTMYLFDKEMHTQKYASVDADFARIVKGKIEIVPKGVWRSWSELGIDWVRKNDLKLEIGGDVYRTQYD